MLNLFSSIAIEESKNFSFFYLIQVLHILTENLQSPGTISFGVPGNRPVKISPKSVRYENINLNIIQLPNLEQFFAC